MRTEVWVLRRRRFLSQELRGVLKRQSCPLEGCACSMVHLPELSEVHHGAHFENGMAGKMG